MSHLAHAKRAAIGLEGQTLELDPFTLDGRSVGPLDRSEACLIVRSVSAGGSGTMRLKVDHWSTSAHPAMNA